jgi:hypothetical protein
MNEEDYYEQACEIWFRPPEGRAARELSSLTAAEREQVWADLTGNAELSNLEQRLNAQQKTHEELHHSVIQLNQLLTQHAVVHQDPLAVAVQQYRRNVCEVRNLIKFLRSQEFNLEQTYEMMILHYQVKQELFGTSKLGKEITLDDLDDKTKACLAAGAYQLSYGATDRAGR